MHHSLSQSLAGRVGIVTLLPLSLHELRENKLLNTLDRTIFNGSYPRLYEEKIEAIDLYPSYIQTYIERDVREMAQVGDILVFQKLMKLCAARVGQPLNVAEMASQLGVDHRRLNQWLSILEASFIIFLLKPHFQNFNKRLTKTPKLYFYDTGVACSLLDIKSEETLALSPFRGNLFESLMISDFYKQYYNLGMGNPSLYFWRDQNGRLEIDCVIDRGDALFPVEMKSTETFSSTLLASLTKWNQLGGGEGEKSTLIYGGEGNQMRVQGKVLSWKSASDYISSLYTKN